MPQKRVNITLLKIIFWVGGKSLNRNPEGRGTHQAVLEIRLGEEINIVPGKWIFSGNSQSVHYIYIILSTNYFVQENKQHMYIAYWLIKKMTKTTGVYICIVQLFCHPSI